MIDLKKIEKYRENNRIEAKKSQGGLPKSIWETYSAFANTSGGIILLGVEEDKDGTLHIIGISNPEEQLKTFWDIINNQNKTSVNILSDKYVNIQRIHNKNIIVIEVPKAQRTDKPIYLDNNPVTGTYRRNGEGDYKCTKEEVRSMMRDAAIKTQDMIVLEKMSLDVFDYESVRRYRLRMKNYRPGHVWEEIDDETFLYKIGAVSRGEDGLLHPTAAGLLMFGFEYEIVKEYPDYFLDYQEQLDNSLRWTDRILSSDGNWSGNLYDFYFKVYNKLVQDIKVPFKIENGTRIDDTSVHNALREALANSIVNSDYYGRRGVVIKRRINEIEISNPGGFRIDIEDAKSGGISDPRNTTLIKMFNLINIGERAGSGIPNIYKTWEEQNWPSPVIEEEFNPDRITLLLKWEKTADKKPPIKTADKKPPIKTADKKPPIKTADKIKMITDYLKANRTAKSAELAKLTGVSERRIREILKIMIEDESIIAEGNNKNRTYKLN